MENVKDFFYYNRKVIIIFVLLSTLYLIPKIIVKKEDVDNPTKKEKIDKIMFKVNISGEVKNPGIYEVSEDKRVEDIINLSGGVTINAEISSINLSEKVRDGMFILIPKKALETHKKDNKVNNKISNKTNILNSKISINNASVLELIKIKGFGRVKAESIVNYRKINGNFKTLEDLMKVKGIGKKTFDKIKDYIKL